MRVHIASLTSMTSGKDSPGKEISQVHPYIHSMCKGWIHRPTSPRCPPGETRQARRAPVSHALVNCALYSHPGRCGADYEEEILCSAHLSYPFLTSHDVCLFAIEPDKCLSVWKEERGKMLKGHGLGRRRRGVIARRETQASTVE